MGIEPTAQAWEAWVLPLYDARSGRLILDKGILVAFRARRQIPVPDEGRAPRRGALRNSHLEQRTRLEELVVCLELQSPSENSGKIRRGSRRVVAARAGNGWERR